AARARSARATAEAEHRRARPAPDPAAACQPRRRRTLPGRAPRLAAGAAGAAPGGWRLRPAGSGHQHPPAPARRGRAAALERRPLPAHRAPRGWRPRAASAACAVGGVAGPRAARVLRGRGSRRHRPLAAGLPAGASAPATHDPAQGPVLAVGLAGPGRQHGAGYRARARTAFGLRVRAGPRAVPPAAGQPFTRVLARGRAALPGLARGTRVLPPRGKATEGAPARPARLRLHTPAIPGTPGDG